MGTDPGAATQRWGAAVQCSSSRASRTTGHSMAVRVLVLDGNENQAVACTRSLARAGFEVWVGSERSWSKAALSRAATGRFRYPAPTHDASAFVTAVAEMAARLPGTVVLPMTERTTVSLSAARESLDQARARYVLPRHEDLLRAVDKGETARLAAAAGVAIPQSVLIRPGGDVHALTAHLAFPLVLKPRSSEELLANGRIRTTGAPRYARTPSDLERALGDLARRTSEVVVQEFVAGDGTGYFALMQHGEVRAEFAHRRLRDVRPTGSGSSLRESVPIVHSLRDGAVAILRALRWHGVAMVEFRLRSDGTPVFLEVNGRFWNSLALAVYSGVDFPALLAEMAVHGTVATPPPYRIGVKCRWLLGDFRHLVAVWAGPPPGYPLPYPRRWRALRDFLTPIRGSYHDNFQLHDPLPAFGDWLAFLGHQVPAALARRREHRKSVRVPSTDTA